MPNLLIVGDVKEAGFGIKRLLEMDHYRVLIAATEQEAVESARHNRPDLLLVDLRRPPLDTAAISRRIRRRARLKRDVPIVIITVVTPEMEYKDTALSHNVHVTYSVEFEQLEDLLRHLLHARAAT